MFQRLIKWIKQRDATRDMVLRVGDGLADIWKYYPRSGVLPFSINTLASIWTVHKILNNEQDPFKWLEQRGYHETFNVMGGFVFNCTTRHTSQGEVVWRQAHSFSHIAETVVRKVTLGDLEIFFTIYEEGGEKVPRRQVYTNLPKEEASVKWADWFWSTLGNAVTFHLEGNAFEKTCFPVSLALTTGSYIGPHTAEIIYEYWKDFWDAGFSRSLFFIGPPGTGKTTVAHQLARMHGGRLLHIVPNIIEQGLGHDHIAPLIQLLTPSVFLIDDIHAVQLCDLQEMLHMLEWINNLQSQTMIIATANRLSAIDEAMRRPGRFDEAFLFEIPDQEERLAILELYTWVYDCTAALSEISCIDHNTSDPTPLGTWLAEQTEKIPAAYLMELAKTVKVLQHRSDIQALLENKIRTMSFLLGVLEEEEEDKDKDRALKKEKPSRKGLRRITRLGFRGNNQTTR